MPEVTNERDYIGLDKGRPDTNLPLTAASQAKNVIFNNQRVEKRRGSKRISPWVIPKSSLMFDGTTYCESGPITATNYVDLGYRHGAAHTLEASVKVPSGTTTKTHVIAHRGLQESNNAYGWGLWFYETDKTFYYREHLDSGNDILFTGTYTAYAPGKPFHVSVRRDGVNCWMHVYDGDYSGKIGEQTNLTVDAVEDSTDNTWAVTFATGWDWVVDEAIANGEFRIQEFRTWAVALSTSAVTSYALKELPAHVKGTDNLKFYYKFNEGSGALAYDRGYLTRLTATATDLFAGHLAPRGPTWVSGLIHGGLGDRALQFDGKDDYFGIPVPNDEYAGLRTGNSDWAVQAAVRPLEQVANDAVFLMYGGHAYAQGTTGFAFQLRASVTDDRDTRNFVARFCSDAQGTKQVTWSTDFDFGTTYYVYLRKNADEVGLSVMEDGAVYPSTWETTSIASDWSQPDFPEGIPAVLGASYPNGGQTPVEGYANCEIDEFRMWGSDRIDPVANPVADLNDPDLLGRWGFNEGSGKFADDTSENRIRGYLVPFSDGAQWSGGFVTPISGPDVQGIYHYQRNENLGGLDDARSRGSLVVAGSAVYRNEGNNWREVAGGKDTTVPWTGDQLGNFFILCNGLQENLLYDGDRVWSAGIEAPTTVATSQVSAVPTAFWDTQTSGGAFEFIVSGFNSLTVKDASRTEQGFSFNGKRVTHDLDSTGTLETRVHRYFKDRTFDNVMVSASATSSYIFTLFSYEWSSGGVFEIPKYGLELGELSVYTALSGTVAMTIQQDTVLQNNGAFRTVHTWGSIGGNIFSPAPTGHKHSVNLSGHFIWTAQASHTIYNTSTYQISLVDAALEGDFYYRYTRFNRFTGIESNPSPPTDAAASPDSQAVLVTLDTETNTNVTDRLIYRTKRSGARDGEFYFLLGTLTGTTYDTFNDVTPNGEEGRLISFYRDKTPQSPICKVFKGRMWYVSRQYPNTLYFSAVDKPGEVDPYNYLIFGDDNDYITGLGVSQDNLVVFKRRSIWLVTRSDVPEGMRPYRLSDRTGCVAHHTIQEVDGEILFYAEDGLYSMRGSDVRKVSSDKTQYYFDRTDPSRKHLAVAGVAGRDGIYRINLSPFSAYATTVDSGVNSWYLDYHYQRSRDHSPFFEPIWAYGEREVSCYGEYVTEDNEHYLAYGDHRGFAYIDNVPEVYTEGLGWYKDLVTPAFYGTASFGATAGDYTVTVSDAVTLFTHGDGLKGFRVILAGAAGTESLTVLENNENEVVFTSDLQNDYSAGDKMLIAPIQSYYESGWMDLGSSTRSKQSGYLKLDYRYETTGTMTVRMMWGREGFGDAKIYTTHSIALNEHREKIEFRGRGKHVKVGFQHDWPGETFHLYNWEFDVNPGRSKGEE